MAPKRRLPHTFPHKITLVISLVLCLCACASIVFGVISLTNHLWGYNLFTGFWTGGVILLAGMFGIVCSFARNTCSVKTFMIISIFGCLASLGMIALSCGGLDASSGFYHQGQITHSLTHTVHAVNLGLGILQLALCVLSDGLCCYYLFYEQHTVMYRVGSTSRIVNKPRKDSSNHSKVKNRPSNGSETPLMHTTVSESRKNSKRKSKTESADVSNVADSDLMVVYATNERQPLTVSSLRQQEAEMASASPPNRHSGVSTFGHLSILGPDQVSLIVHPNDDNASVADTVRTQTPDPLRFHPGRTNMPTENHYAQTLLFEPPLPIEEDDELPPYEAVDSRTSVSVTSDYAPNVCTNIHRSMSLPTRGRRQSERRERTSLRSNIPAGRREHSAPSNPDAFEIANKKIKNVSEVPSLHVSRSAHVLRNAGDINSDTPEHAGTIGNVNTQGVVRRKFDNLENKIPEMGVTLRHTKSQSMFNGREKRLDRRRRALSAEIKWHKDIVDDHGSYMSSDVELRSRTSSMGSSSSLFADSRLSATKFSLRTPMRHSGTQQANVPVPVRPPQAWMFKSPPPKPPRTFSFNADDLQVNDQENSSHAEVQDVFVCIAGLKTANDTAPRDTHVTVVQPLDKTVTADLNQNSTAVKERSNGNAFTNSNSVAMLDTGPVLQCAPLPNKETVQQKYDCTAMTVPTSPVLILSSKKNTNHSSETNSVEKKEDNTKHEHVSKPSSDNTKHEHVSKPSSEETCYQKKSVVSENAVISPISPGTTVKKSRKLLFSFSNDNNVSVFDPSPDHDNSTGAETECLFELKEEISVKHHQPELYVQTRIPSSSETGELKGLREIQSGGLQNISRDPQKLKSGEDIGRDKNSNIESLGNLRVRLPPLSPSERILQRKNLISNIEFGEESSRPKVPKPDAPKGLNGARPKQKLSDFKPPSNHTERRFSEHSTGNTNYFNIPANIPVPYQSQGPEQLKNRENRSYAIPAMSKKFHIECSNVPVVCSPSDSGMTKVAAGCLPSVTTRSQATEAPRFVSPVTNVPLSPRDVTRPSASENSPNVQGVLRLPQLQHARLLPNHEHPVAHAPDVGDNINANGAVNVQHIDRPLFSTLL